MSTRRNILKLGCIAAFGFAVSVSVAPPIQMANTSAAAEYHYFSGDLYAYAQANSGLRSVVKGGRANFFNVGHTASIETERKGGASYQTSTASGQAAIMNHAAVNNARTLCMWIPITSGNWPKIYGQCHTYY